MKKLFSALAVFSLLTLIGWWTYPRHLEAETYQGPLFHDVPVGATADFAVHGATDLHLMSYFVFPKGASLRTSYGLQVAFVSTGGKVSPPQRAELTLGRSPTPSFLPDGAEVTQERLLSLVLPAGTAFLKVSCPDGRVLLRANRLAATKATQEAVLERTGMPATWFASEELQGLRSHGFVALPVLSNLPTVKLPPMIQQNVVLEPAAANRQDLMQLGPHRALVLNVIGPGTLKVAFMGKGKEAFQVEQVGPETSGRAPVKDGRAVVYLPAGPSSVIVRPLGNEAGLVQLESQQLRAIGRADDQLEPSARLGSAWRVEGETVLRFPMYGSKDRPYPVRLTAHALDMTGEKKLNWRFLDERGQELLGGTLQLSAAYDPFAGVIVDEDPVDIGLASQTFLVPPEKTRALEIAAPSALVEVDALLEKGVQTQPLPPFDLQLGPRLRWQDVPVRSARWVMLRPLTAQSEKRELFAKLLRMPRIEPIAPLPEGPWQTVLPQGSVKKLPILEATLSPAGDKEPQALLRTQHTTAIRVSDKGKNARRIVVTCDVPGQLGGELTLRREGKVVAGAPILTSEVRLSTSAPAGISHVRVDGLSKGHCTVAARLVSQPLTVQRSVFLFTPHQGLNVRLRTKRSIPLRLHYAIYAAAENASMEPEVAVLIDRGSPTRRVGSATAATLSQADQVLPLAPVSLPSPSLATGSTLQRVAVSAVQLGDDLRAGNHRVRLRMLSPGRYWARFWIPGRHNKPEAAESFISTDPMEPAEGAP